MILGILAWTGYWVGIGVELFVILICAALLALMLTGLLFKWMASMKESRAEQTAAKSIRAEVKAAEAEARAVAAEEAAALAEAQAEADAAERAAAAEEAAEKARIKAEEEAAARAKAAEEAAAKKAADKAAAEQAEAEKKAQAQAAAAAAKKPVIVAEEESEEEEEVVAEAAVADAEDEDEAEGNSEFVVVHDGIVFNDSKTITELYEELSPEQQSYFDELREEALTKPDSELSIAKNFVTVKIGKRNLIKLLIKRGVTVAEFMLENDALKALRLSNTNKRGKSSIKVKPTVVQVLDLTSLKVAVDMINLAYEEMMME